MHEYAYAVRMYVDTSSACVTVYSSKYFSQWILFFVNLTKSSLEWL